MACRLAQKRAAWEARVFSLLAAQEAVPYAVSAPSPYFTLNDDGAAEASDQDGLHGAPRPDLFYDRRATSVMKVTLQ
jgi:hypothetical protein